MDNHKGSRIYITDDSFDLGKLGKFGNHQKNFSGLVGKSSFSVQKGYATANDLNDFLIKYIGLVRDQKERQLCSSE